jgi:hypothetical protein
VFSVGQNSVKIGTTRKGALAHHKGIPGRLPRRRLWPEVHDWPASWWSAILAPAQKSVIEIIQDALGS